MLPRARAVKLSASDAAELGQTAANQAAFDSGASSAATGRASTDSTATATYNAAVATAQGTYDAAVATATAAFQASGQANYWPATLAWPQAPDNGQPAAAGSSQQPQPPAASNYAGMTYNLSADSQYQGLVAAAETTYTSTVRRQAEDDLAEGEAWWCATAVPGRRERGR